MARFTTIFITTLAAVVAGNPVSRAPAVTEAAHLHQRNTAPASTQSGVASGCSSWTEVKSGDNCGKIATAASVPVASILAWNKGVGAECKTLMLGYGVCIGAPAGAGGAAATATGGAAAPAKSSAAAPAAPSTATAGSPPPATPAVVPATSKTPGGGASTSTHPPPPATTAAAAKNECK